MEEKKDIKTRILEIVEDYEEGVSVFDNDMAQAGIVLIDPKSDFINTIEQELERAREERTQELKQAFHEVFYKSGELWFDYLFEDGDTKAEQDAREVVGEYWKEVLSKLTTK